MRLLLCGPITGDPRIDWPIFKRNEDKLRAKGFGILNPLHIIKSTRKKLGDEIYSIKSDSMTVSDGAWEVATDIGLIMDALAFTDRVFLLPGWDKNSISLTIAFAAQSMGIKFMFYKNEGLHRVTVIKTYGFDQDDNAGEYDNPDEESEAEADDIGNKIRDMEETAEMNDVGNWVRRQLKWKPPKQGGK